MLNFIYCRGSLLRLFRDLDAVLCLDGTFSLIKRFHLFVMFLFELFLQSGILSVGHTLPL